MQQGYFTPIKNIQTYNRQLFNSDSIHRQGDWICLNCQNLNYSFRKICNRCKTQSRADNQKHSIYSYYYYPKFDQNIMTSFQKKQLNHYDMRLNFQFSIDKKSQHQNQQINKQNVPAEFDTIMQTPKKKKPLLSSHNSKLDGLPSVSPLVKKYRQKQHHTTLSKLKNTNNLFESSGQSKQFEQIKIRDFDKLIQDFIPGSKTQIQGSPFKDNLDEDDLQGIKFMKEIQESISKIII